MIDDAEARKEVATLANALGDDTRLRLLSALSHGPGSGLTVTDLSEQLALAQPRISTHLSVLRSAGLVESRSDGRTRVYRVIGERAGPVLRALSSAVGADHRPPASVEAARLVRANTPTRRARSCYDHIGGVLGVALLDRLVFDRWIVRSGGGEGRPLFDLTDLGASAFADLGLDIDALRTGRRVFACGCMDWTERRPHLGGALGAALLSAMTEDSVLSRVPETRALDITGDIEAWFARA
jgi:DNA-binding transcriptional ArsR family regulator